MDNKGKGIKIKDEFLNIWRHEHQNGSPKNSFQEHPNFYFLKE